MSRLSDLYKAIETLRKEGLPISEELEKQVSELQSVVDDLRILQTRLQNLTCIDCFKSGFYYINSLVS